MQSQKYSGSTKPNGEKQYTDCCRVTMMRFFFLSLCCSDLSMPVRMCWWIWDCGVQGCRGGFWARARRSGSDSVATQMHLANKREPLILSGAQLELH